MADQRNSSSVDDILEALKQGQNTPAAPGSVDDILADLGLEPFLYAGMRLGEGTGAVAVMPLLDMGLAVYREMATFEAVDIEAYQPLT